MSVASGRSAPSAVRIYDLLWSSRYISNCLRTLAHLPLAHAAPLPSFRCRFDFCPPLSVRAHLLCEGECFLPPAGCGPLASSACAHLSELAPKAFRSLWRLAPFADILQQTTVGRALLNNMERQRSIFESEFY